MGEQDRKTCLLTQMQIITMFLGQAVVILFWGLFVVYGDETNTSTPRSFEEQSANVIYEHYPMYMDVHVMIFIGFGFLMVFLKSYSWTAVGVNLFIAAWSLEVCVLTGVFWDNIGHYYENKANGEEHGPMKFKKMEVNLKNLIFLAEFGSAAVLITFGGLLGKCTVFQLWVIATIEVCFYSLNNMIVIFVFEAVDIGGAMVIHMFGAYFGLAASFFFKPKNHMDPNEPNISPEEKELRQKAAIDYDQNGGSYYSNLIAMIGNYFLFLYWPSFNGAIGTGAQQLRAVINTLLSITSSAYSAMLISRIFKHTHQDANGKTKNACDVEILLNATLAGGVCMGACADILNNPYYAMICGWVTGVVSAFGYCFLSKFLREKIGLYDTCGIHNLHAMPGFIGGIITAIAVNQHTLETYGDRYGEFFLEYKHGRTPAQQAGYQLASMGVTLGISILTGALAGFLASRNFYLPQDHNFDDREIFRFEEYMTFPVDNKNEIQFGDSPVRPKKVSQVKHEEPKENFQYQEAHNDGSDEGQEGPDQDLNRSKKGYQEVSNKEIQDTERKEGGDAQI